MIAGVPAVEGTAGRGGSTASGGESVGSAGAWLMATKGSARASGPGAVLSGGSPAVARSDADKVLVSLSIKLLRTLGDTELFEIRSGAAIERKIIIHFR